jgi:hypothetical protein
MSLKVNGTAYAHGAELAKRSSGILTANALKITKLPILPPKRAQRAL